MCDKNNENQRDSDPGFLAKAAWVSAEWAGNIVGALQPKSGEDDGDGQPAESASKLSREEAIARLREEYERNYFISGKMDIDLYEDDCLFADPFASFRGRERFKRNLANLKYFVSESDCRLLDLEVNESDPLIVNSRVMVKLRLALPWRPVLGWVWRVRHVFGAGSGRVAEHVEGWDIDPMRGVLQVFRPGPAGALSRGAGPQA